MLMEPLNNIIQMKSKINSAKEKYIKCDIYKSSITVFIGTPDQLKEWCKKTYKGDETCECFNKGLQDDCAYGEADAHFCDDIGVIRLPNFPKTAKDISLATHELLHAVMWMLSRCGIKLDDTQIQNEAYTYLLEYLVLNTLEEKGYKKA